MRLVMESWLFHNRKFLSFLRRLTSSVSSSTFFSASSLLFLESRRCCSRLFNRSSGSLVMLASDSLAFICTSTMGCSGWSVSTVEAEFCWSTGGDLWATHNNICKLIGITYIVYCSGHFSRKAAKIFLKFAVLRPKINDRFWIIYRHVLITWRRKHHTFWPPTWTILPLEHFSAASTLQTCR